MKASELSKLRKEMAKVQNGKRYEHTLSVAYTAANLAASYGEDIDRALVAGLLHDCAKDLSDEKLLAICKKQMLPVSAQEEEKPSLLHAKVGSYLARKKYHITDPDILRAIHNHTTGSPGMSLLEKIIFVADYMEPGRKQAPHLEQIRRIAFADLDQAMIMILEDTLHYLQDSGSVIDETTRKTYEYYQNGGK